MHKPEPAPLVHPVEPSTAQALFDAEQLPSPPVPASLAACMRQQASTVFATRPLQASAYDLGHYLLEYECESALADYALAGFDGHGTNSWAAHCYVVCDGLAMFIQLPWGGAYLDPEPARAEIAAVFSWAALLQSKMAHARQQKLIPSELRLQVVASRLSHAGWRWLDVEVDPRQVPWQPAAGMMATLQRELDDILGRAGAPS